MEEWDNLIFAFLTAERSLSQRELIHNWKKKKPDDHAYYQELEKRWRHNAINTTQFKPDVYFIKGDKGILLKAKNEILKAPKDDTNFRSRQTAKIIYNNTQLPEATAILSRHYHPKISIEKIYPIAGLRLHLISNPWMRC